MILLRSFYEWLFLAIKICRDIQDGAILGNEDEREWSSRYFKRAYRALDVVVGEESRGREAVYSVTVENCGNTFS